MDKVTIFVNIGKLTAFTSLIVFIIWIVKRLIGISIKKSIKKGAVDSALYDKFIDVLPSSGSIRFLREQDMQGSYDTKKLDQLRRFHDEWDITEYHFLDRKLEKTRKKLHALAGRYLHYLGTHSFQRGSNPDNYAIPEDWAIEKPDLYEEVVGTLHNLADQIIKTHSILVNTARKTLRR